MNTTLSIDKETVARNFSAAAQRYDAWANAQQHIACALAARIPAGPSPALIADIGCGTGFLSELLVLRYPGAQLLGIDIAPGMINHCRHRFANIPTARFATGDAEDATFLPSHIGLIASSCVAQWFADPASMWRLWSSHLAPGGVMAIVVLLRGSFEELTKTYWNALQRDFRGLHLQVRESLPGYLESAACRLRVRLCEEEKIRIFYENPSAALRSFQQIGAVLNGQPNHNLLKPGEVRRLLADYERHAASDGLVPVTYFVQYIVAEKAQ